MACVQLPVKEPAYQRHLSAAIGSHLPPAWARAHPLWGVASGAGGVSTLSVGGAWPPSFMALGGRTLSGQSSPDRSPVQSYEICEKNKLTKRNDFHFISTNQRQLERRFHSFDSQCCASFQWPCVSWGIWLTRFIETDQLIAKKWVNRAKVWYSSCYWCSSSLTWAQLKVADAAASGGELPIFSNQTVHHVTILLQLNDSKRFDWM